MADVDWRPLTRADLDGVMRLQEEAYPWHQEERAVFENRLELYPPGCLALSGAEGLQGYLISHPWTAASPPPLDTCLERLPEQPGTYYLHDLALAEAAQGGGHAGRLVVLIARHAALQGLASLSLVAVNNSAPFWERQGFRPAMTPSLAEKLASYGGDAIFMTRALAREWIAEADCPSPPPQRPI
jgi:ribosomal protein S18 acetylase RimI-like enzyme